MEGKSQSNESQEQLGDMRAEVRKGKKYVDKKKIRSKKLRRTTGRKLEVTGRESTGKVTLT